MKLVDNLIQNFSKEVSNIQVRSQKMLKAYNLGQEIRELEQQKTDLLVSIGNMIYDKYQRQISPNEESLQQKCKEIAALEKDIAHLQKQLDSLKAENQPNNSSSTKPEPK